MNERGFVGGVVLAIILVVGLISSVICIEKIPVGYEGVVYSMNGGIQEQTLSQGWHLVSPTKKVKEFTISEEQLNLTNKEAFSVSTSDNAGISISFQMSYSFATDKLVKTYQKFRGMDGEDIINSRVKTVLKSNLATAFSVSAQTHFLMASISSP
jgi:regulator of protease activity HflC (stomatin/prohibitin superfamily)